MAEQSELTGQDPVEPARTPAGASAPSSGSTARSTPWLPAIARLLELPDLDRAFVAVRADASADLLPDDQRLEVVDAPAFADVVRGLPEVVDHPVLLMTAPVLLPADRASARPSTALADDTRVAAVSFLSNAAGHLSFPHRNRPTQYSLEGHDETTLTRLLRGSEPLLPGPDRGHRRGRDAGQPRLPGHDEGSLRVFAGIPEAAVIEMVMRAQRRGLRAVLDPATYVTRLWEGHHWRDTPMEDEPVHRRLVAAAPAGDVPARAEAPARTPRSS